MLNNPDTSKMAKLLAVHRDLLEKLAAVGEEMDALISGKAGIGDRVRDMADAFDAAWGQRYAGGEAGKYVWSYAKDRANIKRLLRTISSFDLARRAVAYICDEDPFLKGKRHPFGLFVLNVNKYIAATGSDAFELVADCRHTPRHHGGEQQACTAQVMREMRA